MEKCTILVPLLLLLASCNGETPAEEIVQEPFVEPEHVCSDNAERLIPRSVLFGNPERTDPQLSPDGTMIAYIAPAGTVLNLWVMNRDLSEPRQLTFDTGRGVTDYFWAENDVHLLYMQDEAGEENTHVYRLDVVTGEVTDLTPFEGVTAFLTASDKDQPNTILVQTNQESAMFFDGYKCDLLTGELTMIFDNPGMDENSDMVVDFMPDEDLNVRMYFAISPENGFITMHHRWDEESPWEELISYSSNEEWRPRRFSDDGRGLYITSNLESDLTGLYYLDIESGEEICISSDSLADVSELSFNPHTGEPRSVTYNYLRCRCEILDESIVSDMDFLAEFHEGDFEVVSRDHADSTWIVVYYTVHNPAVYFLYDRTDGSICEIFTAIPALENYNLAEVEPVEITSRDGFILPCYVTRPDSEFYGEGPYPTIIKVHGGPWSRDSYRYQRFCQLYANRGFAVLQINFRGSTGFGKEFLNAGNQQWGRNMQNDLADGVNWAIENGIADPERVVILGGSYGGYAALAGAAFTPGLYCAAVDFFGPSNLNTFMETIPPYWRPLKALMDIRVGNPDDEADRAMLEEVSPVNFPENITMPILIVQGENDPRVARAESDQMVEALRGVGTEVLYVVYDEEGHGFEQEENVIDFAGRLEEFLYLNVPGVECELFEPLEGSTARIE
ncbi:MAG: alpha/beta fold hydrolase [Candidatus Sabulitectum sp.]|nr:alpha/beta fold hydrolase [Candidatus Sabulitectum sp.]